MAASLRPSPLPTVVLRRVHKGDADMILRWRNEPDTRRWFGEDRRISRAAHARWFAQRLRATAPWWVAMADGIPAGVVRFEGGDGHYEVAILVARKWRQQGVGAAMLAAACQRYRGTLHATILPGNVASEALFQRCGFRQTGTVWEREA